MTIFVVFAVVLLFLQMSKHLFEHLLLLVKVCRFYITTFFHTMTSPHYLVSLVLPGLFHNPCHQFYMYLCHILNLILSNSMNKTNKPTCLLWNRRTPKTTTWSNFNIRKPLKHKYMLGNITAALPVILLQLGIT